MSSEWNALLWSLSLGSDRNAACAVVCRRGAAQLELQSRAGASDPGLLPAGADRPAGRVREVLPGSADGQLAGALTTINNAPVALTQPRLPPSCWCWVCWGVCGSTDGCGCLTGVGWRAAGGGGAAPPSRQLRTEALNTNSTFFIKRTRARMHLAVWRLAFVIRLYTSRIECI